MFDAAGIVLDEQTSLFTIAGSVDPLEPVITLRTTTDKPVYHTSDQVQISNLVQNITDNTTVDDAVLSVVVTAPDGSTVFSEEIPLVQLNANAITEKNVIAILIGAVVGEYIVSGVVTDSQGQILATDLAVYTVINDPTTAIVGTVTAAYERVEIGQLQQCTDVVMNTGSIDIDALPVRQILVQINPEAQINEIQQTIRLEVNAATTLVREEDTGGFELGSYACVLQAYLDDESGWMTLDFDTFIVEEPPIELDSAITLGSAMGRILILLDAPKSNECEVYKSLTLSTELHRDLRDASRVEINVFDKHYNYLDSETGRPSTFPGVINNNFGNDTDLSITSLTSDAFEVELDGSVSADGALNLPNHLTAKVRKGHKKKLLRCDIIKPRCHEPIQIGDRFGLFTVTDVQTKDPTDPEDGPDPFGPDHAPSLATQRTHLETLLTGNGYSYDMVTSKEAFEAAFLTGGYSAYAILSEAISLSESIQAAVVEAVNAGDGLLITTQYQPRRHSDDHHHGQGSINNQRILQELGVSVHGQDRSVDVLQIEDSSITDAAGIDLPFVEKPMKIRRYDGEQIAVFPASHHHRSYESNGYYGHHRKKRIAVIRSSYGNGETATAAFDILAQMTAEQSGTSAGEELALNDLFMKLVQTVAPETLPPSDNQYETNAVIPLDYMVDYAGDGAQTGTSRIILTDGATVIDPGRGEAPDSATIAWSHDYTDPYIRTDGFWIQLPDTPGEVTVDGRAIIGAEDGVKAEHETSLVLPVYEGTTITDQFTSAIQAALAYKANNPRSRGIRNVIDKLNAAKQHYESGELKTSWYKVLLAIQHLKSSTKPEIQALRLELDRLLESIARQFN